MADTVGVEAVRCRRGIAVRDNFGDERFEFLSGIERWIRRLFVGGDIFDEFEDKFDGTELDM